jgi:hypothetical protein
MGQVCQCWCRICRKCFLQVRISHVLYFISIRDLFIDPRPLLEFSLIRPIDSEMIGNNYFQRISLLTNHFGRENLYLFVKSVVLT